MVKSFFLVTTAIELTTVLAFALAPLVTISLLSLALLLNRLLEFLLTALALQHYSPLPLHAAMRAVKY